MADLLPSVTYSEDNVAEASYKISEVKAMAVKAFAGSIKTITDVPFPAGTVFDTTFDFLKVGAWNTDHTGECALKEMWISSDDDYDVMAVREDGSLTDYVQSDYKLKVVELYYFDPAETSVPNTFAEVVNNCKLVATLSDSGEHVDVSGKKWNVSLSYFERGRSKTSEVTTL